MRSKTKQGGSLITSHGEALDVKERATLSFSPLDEDPRGSRGAHEHMGATVGVTMPSSIFTPVLLLRGHVTPARPASVTRLWRTHTNPMIYAHTEL